MEKETEGNKIFVSCVSFKSGNTFGVSLKDLFLVSKVCLEEN